VTATYRTIATPADFAAEMNLTGLFALGTNEASSIYNHATATSGTAVGAITYGDGYATFAAGQYIDTGVVDPPGQNLTIVGVSRQSQFQKATVAAYTGTSFKTGMGTNEFGFKAFFRVSGSGTNTASVATDTTGLQRVQGSDWFFIGSYTGTGAGGDARGYDPRYKDELYGAMSNGVQRVSTAANFMIGAYNSSGTYFADTTNSLVLLADYAMSADEEVYTFEWVSQYLHSRAIYP
jgi:hypothetical protein